MGKLLILFDGLDEVTTSNVDNVIRRIGDFVDRYSQNRFIASCRGAAYKGGFTRFTEVEMAEFDDAQIEAYIKNWFDSTPDQYRRQLDTEMETAQLCWKRLNEAEHEATKELARNPLLLTLVCMVYDSSQHFPRNRAALYESAFNIFLKEWAAEKRVPREDSISQYLDIADERWMLSEIAAKNFEKKRLFFSEDELIDQIREFGASNINTPPTFNATKILETIVVDQGLFVEQVSGSYSFSHLTFQEYLTANYVVRDTRSIRGLVSEHLHDDQWREVFLLTAGRMHQADDLLVTMEVEAAKFINTDRLKKLLRWSERITNTTDSPINAVAKRRFAIRQYFSLKLLNAVHEGIKHNMCEDEDFERYFDRYLDLHRYLDRDGYPDQDRYLDQYFDRYLDLHHDLDQYFDLHHDPDRDGYLDRYLDLDRCLDFDFDLYLYLYQDFYRYMDADFFSSEFGDRFDKELEDRITFVRRMGQEKIFKRVNLQRIVRRFNAQRKFIKADGNGELVNPPEESIHDTWLSVLRITDDMLAISHEDLENYVRYLRAVDLIIDCKEAAGRVSPEVWEGIEKRFLTLDAVKVGRTRVAKSS